MSGPLSRLVALAAEEHRLAAAGVSEGLAEVQEELGDALAALPTILDDVDRAALSDAFALRQQTIELLRMARDEAAAQVAKLDNGRAAMRGYAPAGVAPGRSVDTAV